MIDRADQALDAPRPAHDPGARAWVVVVLAATMIARFALVHYAGPHYNLNSDDRSYLVTAKLWLEAGMLTYNDPSRPTVFIMPGYPAMLAALTKVFGPGERLEQAIRFVQAVLFTGALWVLFLIGRRVFSDRAAAIGVTLAALYPPMWVMSNLILTEALFVPALALLVLAALHVYDRPSARSAALFGLAWLGAIYVRPTVALWPALFLALLLLRRHISVRALARCSAIAASVLVLGLAPWWIRNFEVSGGHFVPLAKSSGNPLWLGSYPDGTPSLEDQVKFHRPYPTLWQQDEFDLQWAKRRIIEGFRADPVKWLRWYTIDKFVKFWSDPYYWIPLPHVPIEWVKSYQAFLYVAGILGAWAARRNRAALVVVSLVLYINAVHMVFLAHGRYSAPLMPFVALFAGYLLALISPSRELRQAGAS